MEVWNYGLIIEAQDQEKHRPHVYIYDPVNPKETKADDESPVTPDTKGLTPSLTIPDQPSRCSSVRTIAQNSW